MGSKILASGEEVSLSITRPKPRKIVIQQKLVVVDSVNIDRFQGQVKARSYEYNAAVKDPIRAIQL